MQILNKAGLLNVPSWYSAGKVAQDSSNIPFGARSQLPRALSHNCNVCCSPGKCTSLHITAYYFESAALSVSICIDR